MIFTESLHSVHTHKTDQHYLVLTFRFSNSRPHITLFLLLYLHLVFTRGFQHFKVNFPQQGKNNHIDVCCDGVVCDASVTVTTYTDTTHHNVCDCAAPPQSSTHCSLSPLQPLEHNNIWSDVGRTKPPDREVCVSVMLSVSLASLRDVRCCYVVWAPLSWTAKTGLLLGWLRVDSVISWHSVQPTCLAHTTTIAIILHSDYHFFLKTLTHFRTYRKSFDFTVQFTNISLSTETLTELTTNIAPLQEVHNVYINLITRLRSIRY